MRVESRAVPGSIEDQVFKQRKLEEQMVKEYVQWETPKLHFRNLMRNLSERKAFMTLLDALR